jgi:DNA-binding response OmpR family regulator
MSGTVPPAGGTGFLEDSSTRPDRDPAAGTRILVVDDDRNVARLLFDLLARHGFASEHVDSGEKALERLDQVGGVETCARIRERSGPALPVLMLTGITDAASLREGYEAGADDYLPKPIDSAHLILKVRAFLRLKTLHDEINRNRQFAQARARDLALLHEISRDWSLLAEPEEFHRTATERLAALIGAPVCLCATWSSPSTARSSASAAGGPT